MKKVVTQFDRWFRAQFGHHPDDYRSYSSIREDLEQAKRLVEKYQKEEDDKSKCSEQYLAASYAKNAKPGFKI